MKFIELFAGIGGFRIGLEMAGHECVWSNEIVEKARSIYEFNFKDKPDPRDIRTIQPDEIPDCELLVGGFPCATFSVAGRRTGFGTEDTRGTLFFEICRILNSKRIPYVFLENVKGLLNHDGGRTFGVIIASLDELGYDVQWECVNSKNFGVPQNRERVFIVGSLRGHTRPKIFPLGRCYAENDGKSAKTQGQGERIRTSYLPTLDAHYYKGGGTRAVIDEGNESNGYVRATQWRRTHFRDIKGDYAPTLTANMGTGGNNVPYIVGSSLRKLTPLECERLQSLPDNWTKWYSDGSLVGDAQRYERCGRSVTVNVIYEIAKRLKL